MLKPLIALSVIAATTQPASAFMGLFEPTPPEVSVEYNERDCGALGGIKLTVTNPTDEPLAYFGTDIKVFRPESSRTAAQFGFGSDGVVPAKASYYFCTRIPQSQVEMTVAAMHPNMSLLDISFTYGNPLSMPPSTYLTGAIFQVEVTSFKYGLPY